MDVSSTMLYWTFYQDDADWTAANIPGKLANHEREYYDNIGSKQRGNEYLLSRLFVRQALDIYFGQKVDWQLVKQESGALRIANPEFAGRYAISLSHSRGYIVLAVSHCSVLGVDVEVIDGNRRHRDIAQHYFHDQDNAYLNQLQQDAYLESFYRLWTLKEALVKATGVGLISGLAQFTHSQLPWSAESLLDGVTYRHSNGDTYHLCSIKLDSVCIASLAIGGNAVKPGQFCLEYLDLDLASSPNR